jgi:ABC-2 type transport system permease protein
MDIGSPQEVDRIFDRGRVSAVIRIPNGFTRALKKGRETEVQIIVDGTDSNTATVVMNYARQIVNQYTMEKVQVRFDEVTRRIGVEGGRVVPSRLGPITVAGRALYNPNLESRNFFVPGVIAMIVMLMALMLTAMSVVREKEIGTMEQLMVTPIRPVELILGKTLPFALIALVDVVLITAVGVLWFHVPIRGNLLLLLLSTCLYLLSSLGIGLFISTISTTQQQAMMGTFFFFAPAILLSGFVFPIHSMPTWIQALTYVNPLRYFLVVIRGIFLKGIGLDILWPQMAALCLLGICVMSLSVMRFRINITKTGDDTPSG